MSDVKYNELNQVLEDLKNGKIQDGTTEIKISKNCSVRIRKSQHEVLSDCDLESMTRDELLEKVNATSLKPYIDCSEYKQPGVYYAVIRAQETDSVEVKFASVELTISEAEAIALPEEQTVEERGE